MDHVQVLDKKALEAWLVQRKAFHDNEDNRKHLRVAWKEYILRDASADAGNLDAAGGAAAEPLVDFDVPE